MKFLSQNICRNLSALLQNSKVRGHTAVNPQQEQIAHIMH